VHIKDVLSVNGRSEVLVLKLLLKYVLNLLELINNIFSTNSFQLMNLSFTNTMISSDDKLNIYDY
jgi:hypothetical protein